MEGMEEVVPDLPDFGAGGRGHQDVGDVLQGSGSGGAPVHIR